MYVATYVSSKLTVEVSGNSRVREQRVFRKHVSLFLLIVTFEERGMKWELAAGQLRCPSRLSRTHLLHAPMSSSELKQSLPNQVVMMRDACEIVQRPLSSFADRVRTLPISRFHFRGTQSQQSER